MILSEFKKFETNPENYVYWEGKNSKFLKVRGERRTGTEFASNQLEKFDENERMKTDKLKRIKTHNMNL